MATAVFRPNAHLAPSMHMLPMMVSAGGQTPVLLHHHHHHHHLQQQQHTQHTQHTHHSQPLAVVVQQPQHGKRAIAPASAQHPRTLAPLHPNNGQQRQAPQPHPNAQLAPKSTKSTASKLPFHPHPVAPYPLQPASVQRRNARERNRVKQVNNGFANLRQHIPSDVITALSDGTIGRGASKKLSKVDTLKLAVEYIRRLQDLIDETDADASGASASSGGMHGHSGSSDVHSTSSNSSSSSSYYSTSPPASSTMLMSADQQSMIDSHRSTASPTPSYISDVSSSQRSVFTVQSGSGGGAQAAAAQPSSQPEYKYEPYDSYNAEDEELLDCITWWQQQ